MSTLRSAASRSDSITTARIATDSIANQPDSNAATTRYPAAPIAMVTSDMRLRRISMARRAMRSPETENKHGPIQELKFFDQPAFGSQ